MARRRRFFRFWTRDELIAAIKDVESAMTSGARFVNYVGGGSVTYVQDTEFQNALRALYDALDDLDGVKPPPRVQFLLTYTPWKDR